MLPRKIEIAPSADLSAVRVVMIMSDKAKILIIEDEPSVSMMMTYLLTYAGCEVASAWNATKGMELAQNEHFDLITLDVDLPGMNGFEICRRLKEDPRLLETPIVFVSARMFEDDKRRGFEVGAVDYITKPFEASDFISRILSHARTKERVASDAVLRNANV
jgi:DNA-binding response OmpR family regulator